MSGPAAARMLQRAELCTVVTTLTLLFCVYFNETQIQLDTMQEISRFSFAAYAPNELTIEYVTRMRM